MIFSLSNVIPMAGGYMESNERLRLAQHLKRRGFTLPEIRSAIELTEIKPLAIEEWNKIKEFVEYYA